MKRILCVVTGLIALATFSGCCCCSPQSYGCGTCGAQGYPSHGASYGAPLGGSCNCGY